MTKLSINGLPVEAPPGATILAAARSVGVEVPTLCHLNGGAPFTSCMVCVVEDETSGRLLPACSAPAEDGMAVLTESEEVREARREVLDLLLREHAGDCLAPCELGCPVHADIPSVLRALEAGDERRALFVARRSIPFPDMVCGACPAPCERACRRGRFDAPVSIRELILFAGRAVTSPSPDLAPGKTVDATAWDRREDVRAAHRSLIGAGRRRSISRLGTLLDGELEELMKDAAPYPRVTPSRGGGAKFNGHEAFREARRCLRCDCVKKHACSLRRHAARYGAWGRTPGGPGRKRFERTDGGSIAGARLRVQHEPGKCVKCGICIRIAESRGENPGLAFLGRGYGVRVGVPFGGSFSSALSKTAEECGRACPTGALALIPERSARFEGGAG